MQKCADPVFTYNGRSQLSWIVYLNRWVRKASITAVNLPPHQQLRGHYGGHVIHVIGCVRPLLLSGLMQLVLYCHKQREEFILKK